MGRGLIYQTQSKKAKVKRSKILVRGLEVIGQRGKSHLTNQISLSIQPAHTLDFHLMI